MLIRPVSNRSWEITLCLKTSSYWAAWRAYLPGPICSCHWLITVEGSRSFGPGQLAAATRGDPPQRAADGPAHFAAHAAAYCGPCAESFRRRPGKPRPVASQGTEGIEHGAGRGSQTINLHRFWPWRGRVTAPVQTASMARIGVASLWAPARATRPRSGTGRCRRGTAQSNAVSLALMIGRASGEPSCKICFVWMNVQSILSVRPVSITQRATNERKPLALTVALEHGD